MTSIRPTLGVDASWGAALHVASHGGRVFGRDVVFTYGPLGFLNIPKLYYPSTTLLAMGFTAALTAVLAATLLMLLRRSLTPWPAFVAALILVKLVPLEVSELLPLVIVMWCLIAALAEPPPGLAPFLPALLGIAAAVSLLLKFSGGVLAVAAVLIAGMARGRESSLKTLGGLVGGLVAFWTLATRSPWGIPRFLARSFDIAAGYSEAMAIAAAPRNAPLDFVALACLFAAVVTIAALRTRRSRHVPIMLILFVLMAVKAKHGLVRHDGGHVASVLAMCMLVPFVWWRAGRPNRAIAGTVIAAGLFLYGTGLAHRDVAARDLVALVNPVRSSLALVRHAYTVVSPPQARAHVADSRAALLRAAAVDDALRARLQAASLHVDPTETSLVWALDARWSPPPVFQMYSAYTPRLDAENAAHLTGASAPQSILRSNDGATVDRHWPPFETPAYMRAVLCNYKVESTGPNWQVLAPLRNRCGADKRLTAPQAIRDGVTIPVPTLPAALVYGRLACHPSVSYRVVNLLWRPRHFATVQLNDRAPNRFVPATAVNGLVLRAPTGRRLAGLPEHYAVDTVRFRNLPGKCSMSFWATPFSAGT